MVSDNRDSFFPGVAGNFLYIKIGIRTGIVERLRTAPVFPTFIPAFIHHCFYVVGRYKVDVPLCVLCCGTVTIDQNKIFERFTKVDTFTQGTGLGLSICKNIIEKMKGRIGVESEGKDKGSTFWFTIPYKQEIATQQNKQHEAVNPTTKVPQQKPVILIAEDNENNYLLFDSILNKEYNLIHAWNGEEAIELYRKFQPHVIIMDINMPKMDGYEAAREIRKFSKTIPIIAVTAYSFSSDKEKVLENGFNGYVPKPVDVHILKEKLHSTIKQNIAAI